MVLSNTSGEGMVAHDGICRPAPQSRAPGSFSIRSNIPSRLRHGAKIMASCRVFRPFYPPENGLKLGRRGLPFEMAKLIPTKGMDKR